VLIYLLIVINFQSWIDPFVIVMALRPTAGIHKTVGGRSVGRTQSVAMARKLARLHQHLVSMPI